MVLIAFDLTEVGQGTVFSFKRVRRIYLNKLREKLVSEQVRSCCQMDKQAVLNRLFKRYGIEFKSANHAAIGLLEKGQELIIIKVKNIEMFDRLLQEKDLYTEEQIRKAGIEFELYVATEFKFQKILPRPKFST